MQELTLAVVGIDYPNRDGSNRRFAAMMTLPGEPVALVPEPKNPHDRHAIAVIGPRGVQIGYLGAERASYIGSRISRGEEVLAIFQGMEGTAAFVRARFGGRTPTLPEAAGPEAAGPEPVGHPAAASPARRDGQPDPQDPDGFYPDEDGPEFGA